MEKVSLSETTYEFLTRTHLVICQITSDSGKMFEVQVLVSLHERFVLFGLYTPLSRAHTHMCHF